MALGAVFALAAGSALAEGGPKPEAVDAFVQAVAAAGCVLDDSNRAGVLKAAGMGEPEAEVIVLVLVQDGRAVLEPDRLVLKTGGCGS